MTLRVGSLGYATEQGLGHLLRDFHRHGVVDSVFVLEHPHYPNKGAEWYPGAPRTPLRRPDKAAVWEWAGRQDVLLFFETPFLWDVLLFARQRGVGTALVVMHEWFPERPPAEPDLYLCPSLLDKDYFPQGTFLPVPAPAGTWKLRTEARRYLHNAGHVGHGEHKGTRQLLQAMKYVKSDLRLTVRCQNARQLEKLAWESGAAGDPRLELVDRSVPYEGLFADHDVYVAPEKWNGLSLPLQEAHAAGLLVMTTERYPATTWLPNEPMITPYSARKARVAPGYLEVDESVLRPEDIAAEMDEWFGKDITAYSERGRRWVEENSWAVLGPKYREALERIVRK